MAVANLAFHRRLTREFIAANPTSVVLSPRTKVKKPAGGWVWETGAARQAQVMTIIEETGLAGQPNPQVTVDGVDREVKFTLLGEWDAALERGDVFTHQGKEWEVVDLYYDNGYERRALVSARG